MILMQDPETGYWTKFAPPLTGRLINVHDPAACEGRLCDIHDRRGAEPWASWPLNWREDRGCMEMIDPDTGIGHPTPAQAQFWETLAEDYLMTHGCDGGCRGAYGQLKNDGGANG